MCFPENDGGTAIFAYLKDEHDEDERDERGLTREAEPYN